MKKDDGGKAAVARLQTKVEELNAALRSSNTGQRALRDQLRKVQSEHKKVKGYEARLAEADEIAEKSKIELRRCDSLLRVSLLECSMERGDRHIVSSSLFTFCALTMLHPNPLSQRERP